MKRDQDKFEQKPGEVKPENNSKLSFGTRMAMLKLKYGQMEKRLDKLEKNRGNRG